MGGQVTPYPLLVQVAGGAMNADGSADSIARPGGMNLDQLMRTPGWRSLTWAQRMEEIKLFLVCCAKGLQHLHQKGRMVYRDMKPENLLYNAEFQLLQVADLGLTVPMDAEGRCVEASFYSGMTWGECPTSMGLDTCS